MEGSSNLQDCGKAGEHFGETHGTDIFHSSDGNYAGSPHLWTGQTKCFDGSTATQVPYQIGTQLIAGGFSSRYQQPFHCSDGSAKRCSPHSSMATQYMISVVCGATQAPVWSMAIKPALHFFCSMRSTRLFAACSMVLPVSIASTKRGPRAPSTMSSPTPVQLTPAMGVA